MRRFILAPACDVAADWTDPVSGLALGELLARLANGAGSLRVLTVDRTHALKIAAEASSRAGASLSVVDLDERWAGSFKLTNGDGNSDARRLKTNHGREIEIVPLPSATSGQLTPGALGRLGSELPAAKLSVYLAARASRDGAWEDIHREAAIGLGMKATEPSAEWPIPGAKYLLASDDEDWAIHELTAALEAMDCPVEPISG